MKKRLLAILLALALVVSLMPVGVLAAPSEDEGQIFHDKDAAIEATGVTAKKTLESLGNNEYKITLSVEGGTSTSTTTTVLPADIVLVVDTSLSMNDAVTTGPCDGTSFTYSFGIFGIGSGWYCDKCGAYYGWSEPDHCTNTITASDRLDVAQAAAKQFASTLLEASDDIHIAVCDFSGQNYASHALTDNYNAIENTIDSFTTHETGTNYGAGLSKAADLLNGSNNRAKIVVFLSDGEPDGYAIDLYGTTAANSLKNNGTTIFSVGIDVDSGNALKDIASSDNEGNKYYYEASTDGSSGATLSAILRQITQEIPEVIHSGTNAVMTDVINTDAFEYVEDSASSNLNVSGDTLTWNIGTIGAQEQTASFTVKLKDGVYGEDLHTNDSVKLEFYSNGLEDNVTFETGAIGDPTVSAESPEPDLNGTAFKIKVYVDEKETDSPYAYIEVPKRYNGDSDAYTGWDTSISYKGVITCSFDYNPDEGVDHDCADVLIELKDPNKYYIQGITYYQSYGESGPKDVKVENGKYVIDNVSEGYADYDVNIFIYTKYKVEYYLDNNKLEDGAYNDESVYVIGRRINPTNTSDKLEEGDARVSVQWRNPVCEGYEFQITGLPDLPEKPGYDVSGWVCGSNGNTYGAGGTLPINTILPIPPADGNTIKFYATSTEIKKVNAGYFVLDPERFPDGFDPSAGYPTESYYPNAKREEVTFEGNDKHEVDDTTGYIGYLTEDGEAYFNQHKDEEGRLVIDEGFDMDWLILPEDFGQMQGKYGKNTIVPYQINNHTLGDSWPNVTKKDTDGSYDSHQAYHVDCYIKNVKVDVIYDANYKNGGQYTHEDGATTGGSYTVLGNDGHDEDKGPNFTREGYTFTGWNTDPEGNGTSYSAGATISPVTSGIVLYAQWEKIPTYSVSYEWSGLPTDGTVLYDEDGDKVTPTRPEGATNLEEGDNYTVDSTYGENYTLYTKDVYGNNNASYTFSGWTSAKDANNEEVTISNGALTMPGANVTITGTWEYQSQTVTPHNVTYQWMGFPEDATNLPELPQSGTYFNNQTVTITGEYTTHKIGHDTYTFQGWSSADATITGNSFTMPDKDVTVTGTWAKTDSDPTYTVTYNAGEDAPATYSTLPTQQRYYENDTVTVAAGLTTDETTKDGVPGTWTFDGWYKGDEKVTTFTMPAEAVTLTGKWEFTPADGAYTIEIQPADIGIYTGGDGYKYVVDGTSTDAEASDGLPEPGYYITLPEWLNDKLQEDGTAVDLSGKLTFSYGEEGSADYRVWELKRYDSDGDSTAYGNFVYRLLPALDDQDNVRLQFYNDTETIVSDQFTPTPGALHQEYSMTIYGGEVETGAVKAKITVDGEVVEFTTEIEPGTLTIRGVTASVDTVELNGEPSDAGFAAKVEKDTTYTINGSSIGLNDASGVQLLVDELVEAEDPETTEAIYNALTEKALETIGSTLTSEVQADFAYMNLVDTNNGHVYVTPSKDVTVTWPYPAGTDSGDKFYVVHFTSMHRGENLAAGTIASADTELLEVRNTENGIQFSVDSFSPFVLVYEKPETAVNVEKSASDYRPEVGDRVKYTLVVENTGNTTTDITVGDSLWKAGTVIILDDTNHTRVELTGNSHTFLDVPANATITITYYYTPTWRDVGRLVNEATVTAGEVTDSDTVTVIVDDGWTPNIPDDDDEDVEPEVEYTPNWLNTDDHFAYIVGYEDGSVRPTANITRAEVATIFFRLLTDEARAEFWSSENDFTDVASDAWYNNAVSTLSGMGILGGYEDGSFRPNASITRAEFVAIATRFFEYSARYEGGFTDVSYGDWYADCVQASADMGLVNGYEDGSFRPNASITRAEACAIVNRVLHRIPHEDHLLSESVMNVWPDNPKSAWYYADMQEATNSHDYDWTRESGSVVEDWTDKLPERDWSALETEWANAYSK